jgi:hypothetical protein
VDLTKGTARPFSGAYRPRGWRSDNRLICSGSDCVAIVTEEGEVEKVFPINARDEAEQ